MPTTTKQVHHANGLVAQVYQPQDFIGADWQMRILAILLRRMYEADEAYKVRQGTTFTSSHASARVPGCHLGTSSWCAGGEMQACTPGTVTLGH